MKRLMMAVGLAVLAGCKMNVTPEVYVSDLRAVAGGEVGLTTPASIAIEVPSTDKCDEYTGKVAGVLTGILDDYEPRGCSNGGMNSYLNLEAQIPLYDEAGAAESTSLFSVISTRIGNGGRYDGLVGVCLYLKQQRYALLNARMDDAFNQTLNLEKSKVGMLLNNDEKETLTYHVAGGAFLNGTPVYLREQFDLRRRRNAEFVFSNVGAAAMEAQGGICPIVLEI